MPNFLSAIRRSVGAFRKELQTIAPDGMNRETYSLYEARAQRIALFEALWENSAYDSGEFGTHTWANSWKTSRGLYKYTRGLANPTYRLVEFWATHLMGGRLDPAAGDAIRVPSALPIITTDENTALRKAIATYWKASKWESKKTVYSRQGSLIGDAILRLWVDEKKKVVRGIPTHPVDVTHVEFNDEGQVVYYRLEQERPIIKRDPLILGGDVAQTITYVETCELAPDGKGVFYETKRGKEPWDFRGTPTEPLESRWRAPWPFVPMVWVQHIDLGRDAGISEVHAAVEKITGLDDSTSKLDDFLRRNVNGPWFFSGMSRAELDTNLLAKRATAKTPQPGREEVFSIAASDPQARAVPMVSGLDMEKAGTHITRIQETLERDYPELRYDRIRVMGDASAKALREARKSVVTKVEERRKNYDPGMVAIHRMAAAIGGGMNFTGYEGFSFEDWESDKTEHTIGTRPVFEVEDMDRIEEDLASATTVATWVGAGVPLQIALERDEWDKDVVAETIRLKEEEDEKKAKQEKDMLAMKGEQMARNQPPKGGTKPVGPKGSPPKSRS